MWLALFLVAATILFGLFVVWMPGRSYSGPVLPLSDEENKLSGLLQKHVKVLADEIGNRSVYRYQNLQAAEHYLIGILQGFGYQPQIQRYALQASSKAIANLSVDLRGSSRPEEVIVIGAHYDSVGATCPGANDNGSGVAAVLELAREFRGLTPYRTIRLVLFVNEEPPFFGTADMGSVHFVRSFQGTSERMVAMISLETLGYYSDQPGSQKYPFPFSLFYPNQGQFIGFVGNMNSARLVRKVISSFRQTTKFPSEGVSAPASIPGIAWSDQWAFWQAGYPALMVTDTAPFRYPHYHLDSDTADKLDYEKLARVVTGMKNVILKLSADRNL